MRTAIGRAAARAGLAVSALLAVSCSTDASNGRVPGVLGELAPVPPGVPLLGDVWSLTDAVSNGRDWFILDRRAGHVHRIDAQGLLLSSFGREGLGPGEFRNPQALVVHGDSVIVADRSGLLHVYGLEGDHFVDRQVDLHDCTAPQVEDLISTADALALVVVCLKQDLALEARLLATANDGDWRVIGLSSPSHGGDRRVNPYWAPVLTSLGRALVFGLVAEDCLEVVGSDGVAERRVCHDRLQRLPVSRADARSLRDLARLGQGTGFRVTIPSTLPPFDAVFDGGDGTLLYRTPSLDGREAKRLIRLRNDGHGDVLDLPAAPHVFVSGRHVLLAWDATQGSHVQFQTLEPIKE